MAKMGGKVMIIPHKKNANEKGLLVCFLLKNYST
jgi:hypothetical protein